MVLGPTQPPIQWVPKTIYGPGTHPAPNSVDTKDSLCPWGPPSPQFSGYQRPWGQLTPIHWVPKTIYGPGTHPAYDPVSKCAPFHAMKTYNPCTRWRWMVNLKPQPCYLRKLHSSYRIGDSVDHRVSANILEEGKHLAPTRILIPDYLPMA